MPNDWARACWLWNFHMSNINVSFDERIMTIAPDGILTADDVVRSVNEYYPSSGGWSILWDMMRADISSLTEQDFVRIASTVRKVLPPGGLHKTAFAVAHRSSYLMMSKYINKAVSARVPVEYSVFTNFAAAKQWLEKR
jgi:hypothetical protein